MGEYPLLRIGEFAQIAQVSIATLRHYDQYGLLKPSLQDAQTGYRYYSLAQLARLHRIVALKELGLPLEQIARLLEESLSLEQLRGMFRLKQAQLRQLIDLEQARLELIAARIRQIEQEGCMPVYEVLLKQVEPLLVATTREMVSIEEDLQQWYARVSAYLAQYGVRQTRGDLLLRHSRYEVHAEGISADLELAVPLDEPLPATADLVEVRTLPGGLMASVVHTGETFSAGRAYLALHRWIQENGYRLIAAPRQVYLQHGKPDHSAHEVIEIQFPVEKVALDMQHS